VQLDSIVRFSAPLRNISKYVRKLGRKCVRKVSSTAMRSALERLRQGLHPTRPLFVGVPAPFLLRPATIQVFEDEESEC